MMTKPEHRPLRFASSLPIVPITIRFAALSDDGRLEPCLNNRPGSPYTHKTTAKAYKPLNC